MHGNADEWCQDWNGDIYNPHSGDYANWNGDNTSGTVSDPSGPTTGSSRVHRGGGWYHTIWDCESGKRSAGSPALGSVGFRVALSMSE